MKNETHDLSLQEVTATILAVLGLLISGSAVILAFQKWPATSSLVWEIQSPAEVGDFIGGTLGAAFGLTGTLLFFAALLYQGSELKAQKRELRLQREVAKQQAESLRKQNDISERNALYERVFSLVDRLIESSRDCRSQGISENKDGSWHARDIEAAKLYAMAYQRAQAIIDLLNHSLEHPCLAPAEVQKLRIFTDLDRLHPPVLPSELQFANSQGIPGYVHAERIAWKEQMKREGR